MGCRQCTSCRQCASGMEYDATPAEDPEEHIDSELKAHKLRVNRCMGPVDSGIKYVPPELPNTVQCVKGVDRLDPMVVHGLLENCACALVDVRGDDRSAGTVEGALHFPAVSAVPFAEKVPELIQLCRNQQLVVFMCQYSCHRAPWCANEYRAQTDPTQKVAISLGGFRGWEANQLPVLKNLSTHDDGNGADAYAVGQGLQVTHLASASPLSLRYHSCVLSSALPVQQAWPGSAEIQMPKGCLVSQQKWHGSAARGLLGVSANLSIPPDGTPSQWTWPTTMDVSSPCVGIPLGSCPPASKPASHIL